MVGRLDTAEATRSEYRYLGAARDRATLLTPGTMIVQQPEIPVPLLVQFPHPSWATRASEGRARGRARLARAGEPRGGARRPAASRARTSSIGSTTDGRARLMRFLHTADWHLGRTMRGRSRAAEFEAVLGELVEIAVAEDVQVMLVCGDIWDSTSPSPESDRLLFDALREFIGRDIEVLLIAGNHDSGRKLEALGRLSELLGVYVQPRVRPRDRGGIVTFDHGGEVARVAAIPWVPEGRALNAVEVLADEPEARKHYHDAVARIYAHMAEPSDAGFTTETINLIAGHLFVDGAVLADIDGSERKLHITQAYGVSPEALPSTAQYVALGHIHQPQVMANPATPRTAYSGSLLQLDFGERGQQKGVRIIDAVPGRPVDDRTIPLTAGRELVELHGTIDDVMAAARGRGRCLYPRRPGGRRAAARALRAGARGVPERGRRAAGVRARGGR